MRRRNSSFLVCALALLMLLLLTIPSVGCGSGGNDGNGSAASVVLAAQLPNDWTETQRSTALDAAVSTIEHRLNAYGVAHYVVEKQDTDRILAEVTSVSDVEVVAKLISQTGYLEFREFELKGSSVATLSDYVSDTGTGFFDASVSGSRMFCVSASQDPVAILKLSDNGTRIYTDKDGNDITDSISALSTADKSAQCWMPATGVLNGVRMPLTGAYLESAKSQANTNSPSGVMWVVVIEFSNDGWDLFDQIAAHLYGKTIPQNELGIFLDNALISAPTVNASSYTTAVISGNFDAESSQLLAIQLSSGALPVPLKVVSVTTS